MKIVIGVTSSVSVYKVLNVIRGLIKRGNEVKVIMSRNSTKFVSPILFQSISRNKVFVDNFNEDDPLVHITLSKWGDVFVVLPATANAIGKIANGICDDLVSTVAMAFPYSKRRILVPAMNKEMWENPINQDNLKKLISYGWDVVEPEVGVFASPLEGIGKGRLPDEKTIIYSILRNKEGLLKGKRVLVTAGATKEYIDNVRFISNDSSGIMGLSIALASYLEGADVVFIHGEMKYKTLNLDRVKNIKIISTEDMLNAVKEEFVNCDILFMSAAVSDFRPSGKVLGKLPKEEIESIKLEKTPDILKTISTIKTNQFVVGFALASEELEKYALKKMEQKRVDMIVANKIEIQDSKVVFNPMGNKVNKVEVFTKEGGRFHFEGTKFNIAKFLVKKVSESI
ncbi:MAG: bifunctional phosphopantothenoylcysteine decarboxylase/phosphopantothenate--cysteine ligase CoaBC [Brevinematia bacterium]